MKSENKTLQRVFPHFDYPFNKATSYSPLHFTIKIAVCFTITTPLCFN